MSREIKKGDFVYIERKIREEEQYEWNDTWMPEMDKWVGKVCRVNKIRNNDNLYLNLGYPLKYNFPPYICHLISLDNNLKESLA